MPLTRRQLLLGGASALVLAACSRDGDDDTTSPTSTTAVTVPTTSPPTTPLAAPPFGLGVASGDPDAESVVLWTRLLGATGDHDVVWEVAADEDFARLAAAGVAVASPEHAHSVHVVAGDLVPDTWYWYRFTAGEHRSPVGRTRTAPEDGGERLTFAFASCQSWESGHYTAHAHLADEDVDLVLWLGDYIYEGGANPRALRSHDGPEATTLDAYRARYALYKSDPNLQASHGRAPWVVVWDDHEVDNNYAGDTPEAGAPDVPFLERRAAAYKAWWEHQPTRLDPPTGPSLEINRAIRWGSLATIFALDGRQHRDDQPCDRGRDLGPGCDERDDPERSMLGVAQEAWLTEQLPASSSTWNVLANQTIFAPSEVPLGPTTLYNLDQWDGYPASRDRILEVLAETANPVIVTGDIHASAIGDVRRGDEVIAVEIVGTSITSLFTEAFADLFEAAAEAAGALMADARHRGYVRCEVTPETFRADFRNVDTIAEPTSPVTTASSWVIEAGTPGVQPFER